MQSALPQPAGPCPASPSPPHRHAPQAAMQLLHCTVVTRPASSAVSCCETGRALMACRRPARPLHHLHHRPPAAVARPSLPRRHAPRKPQRHLLRDQLAIVGGQLAQRRCHGAHHHTPAAGMPAQRCNACDTACSRAPRACGLVLGEAGVSTTRWGRTCQAASGRPPEGTPAPPAPGKPSTPPHLQTAVTQGAC